MNVSTLAPCPQAKLNAPLQTTQKMMQLRIIVQMPGLEPTAGLIHSRDYSSRAALQYRKQQGSCSKKRWVPSERQGNEEEVGWWAVLPWNHTAGQSSISSQLEHTGVQRVYPAEAMESRCSSVTSATAPQQPPERPRTSGPVSRLNQEF